MVNLMRMNSKARWQLALAAGFGLAISSSVYAKDLNTEVSVLSGKLSKKLVEQNIKKVASVDFVDLQGRTSELGKYLAEQLSVEMVNEDGISVVDRANINSILVEHKLTLTGLVEPKNAKKLGKFAGVEAILFGTVTILDGSIMLTVKAISTETAQIIAAGKATFKKTRELQALAARPASSSAASPSDAKALQEKPPAALADAPPEKPTKRAGPIAVTVDSVRLSPRGARVFLTIESQTTTSMFVPNGVLIDSVGNELKFAASNTMNITPGKNNLTVETMEPWGTGVPDLKAPFDLSLDFGLAYGTMGAKTLSVSFHGIGL